jgi:hypothetical protein
MTTRERLQLRVARLRQIEEAFLLEAPSRDRATELARQERKIIDQELVHLAFCTEMADLDERAGYFRGMIAA